MLMNRYHLALLNQRVEMYRLTAGNVAAQTVRGVQQRGAVAVIPMVGPIFNRSSGFGDFFGFRSLQWLRAAMAQAQEAPEIETIVIEWDSPGGEVDGTPEFAAELFAMRGNKQIISVSNTMMSSAAYWIGAQADEVVVSPSSLNASVGVWILHQDLSKLFEDAGITNTLLHAGDRKVDANPFEPLSDEALESLENVLRTIHGQFIAATAKARGLTSPKARKQFGDGRTMMAEEAVEVGVADRVETLEQVLARLTGRQRRRRSLSADRIQDGTDAGLRHVPGTAGSPGHLENVSDDVDAVVESALNRSSRETEDDEVVHVAAEPVDLVQCCTRCGEILIDNRGAQVPAGDSPPRFWDAGSVLAVLTARGITSARALTLTLEPTCEDRKADPVDAAQRDRDMVELELILAGGRR